MVPLTVRGSNISVDEKAASVDVRLDNLAADWQEAFHSKTLTSGSDDKTIRLWDVNTGSSLRELKGHTASVSSVALSLVGKTLASGSGDQTIRLIFVFISLRQNVIG